jgi:hypothetical protein
MGDVLSLWVGVTADLTGILKDIVMITVENRGEIGAFERSHRRHEGDAQEATDLLQFSLRILN